MTAAPEGSWSRQAGGKRRRARAFTSHGSEDDTVFVAVALAICIEIVPIHFLMHMYSPLAAWILTALSGYSLLWVLGDMAARRNRPHQLGAKWLRLSYGLRWEAVVPLGAIVAVHGAEEAPEPELTIGPASSGSASTTRRRSWPVCSRTSARMPHDDHLCG